MFLIQNFRNWLKDKNAAVIPMVALMMPVIMGVSGLSIDFSGWIAQQRNLQTAADAAALAGAWELGRGFDSLVEYSATGEAVNNGYDASQNGTLIVVYDEDLETVSVTLTQEAPLFLVRALFTDPVVTRVDATAKVTGVNEGFCILSLNPIQDGTLTTSGSVVIDMPDCGIAVNSKNEEGFKLNGNVTINVDNVSLAGGYDISGGSADFTYNDLKLGAPPIKDPYKDYVPPVPGGCDFTNYSHSGGDVTLTPGTYCGGIKITGNNNVIFEPGIYIMDGGSLDISGNGTITGEEVGFFLTGEGNDYANVDITGGKNISFTSPAAGDEMAGISFFQDPDAPSSTVNKLVGNADLVVDGAMYFPTGEFNIGGTSGAQSDVCTKIIGDTVIVHGTPFIGNDCTDKPIEPIGDPIIKLVS